MHSTPKSCGFCESEHGEEDHRVPSAELPVPRADDHIGVELSKIVIERGSLAKHAPSMPTRERVAAFIAAIEKKQFLEAIPEFYAEDMTAQENNEPPRIGRAAQVANETMALAMMRFEESRVASYVVDGDRVAIHYAMDVVAANGKRGHLEEIAYQVWRGDRIVSERYFYDPAQMAALR